MQRYQVTIGLSEAVSRDDRGRSLSDDKKVLGLGKVLGVPTEAIPDQVVVGVVSRHGQRIGPVQSLAVVDEQARLGLVEDDVVVQDQDGRAVDVFQESRVSHLAALDGDKGDGAVGGLDGHGCVNGQVGVDLAGKGKVRRDDTSGQELRAKRDRRGCQRYWVIDTQIQRAVRFRNQQLSPVLARDVPCGEEGRTENRLHHISLEVIDIGNVGELLQETGRGQRVDFDLVERGDAGSSLKDTCTKANNVAGVEEQVSAFNGGLIWLGQGTLGQGLWALYSKTQTSQEQWYNEHHLEILSC